MIWVSSRQRCWQTRSLKHVLFVLYAYMIISHSFRPVLCTPQLIEDTKDLGESLAGVLAGKQQAAGGKLQQGQPKLKQQQGPGQGFRSGHGLRAAAVPRLSSHPVPRNICRPAGLSSWAGRSRCWPRSTPPTLYR